MKLLIATKNRKKLKELKELLRGCGITLCCLADFDRAPRIMENGTTFEQNAVKKAVKNARFFGMLTLGEDSGLCVRALGGKPGVYSSRFAGRDKSDRKNNEKVLKLLSSMPPAERKAEYVCAIALADEHGLIGTVEGRCQGRIGLEPRGKSGFGYDPIFVIPRYGKSFAELGEALKHTMSHRSRALAKAIQLIKQYNVRHAK